MEEINLKEFWDYYKKYLIIVIMIVFLSVMITFVYNAFFKKPLYSTYTTVVLVKDETADTDTISQSDIVLNQKLVSTYSEIIKSRLVLSQVINDLKLDYSVDQISKEINVKSLSDTEILKITVTDRDNHLAASIANTLAEIFEKEITKIYKLNNVSVIDTAQVPVSPSNNKTVRNSVLVGVLSFVLSSGIVFVIFYFDDTLRNIEDMEAEFGVPLISRLYRDNNGIDLIVDKKPNAPASESIRTLRTNLQFSAIDQELKTILVTSSLPSEGKSFVSANLAISFAQTGKKVLIIDCDLRKGRQHKIFGVNGKNGLSNLLISNITDCNEYVLPTKIKNLYIMPCGSYPPNPSELLNSKKNASLITLLKKHFDVLVLDGVPISGLSDSLILSSLVDKVLIVSSINQTPKSELRNTVKSLESVNACIAGCIANNLTGNKGKYGSYYYYGYEEK